MLLFESKDRWKLSDDESPGKAKGDSLELYLRATQGIIDANINATAPPSKFQVIM